MNTKIYLQRGFFAENAKTIMENDEFKVNLFKYSSGVEAIEVINSRGKIIVLPYMGQMIWRVEFDGIDLTMKNMFSRPRKVNNILDTYGCFAFHSGLLANGCPSNEDTHPMHGEFCCADLDTAWLEFSEDEDFHRLHHVYEDELEYLRNALLTNDLLKTQNYLYEETSRNNIRAGIKLIF